MIHLELPSHGVIVTESPPNSHPVADRTDDASGNESQPGRAAQPRTAPDEARRLAPRTRDDSLDAHGIRNVVPAGFAGEFEGVGRA